MINVNSKLIRQELPHIGSDAFTILFAIASHLGKSKIAWPGIDRIREMCPVEVNGELRPMSRPRAYAGIKRLKERGIIQRKQERTENGDFGKRVFVLTTEYMGIWMGVSNFEMEDAGDDRRLPESEPRLPEFGETPNGETPNGETINGQTEEVNKGEEVNNDEEGEVGEKSQTEKWAIQLKADQMFLETAMIVHKVKPEKMEGLLNRFLMTKRALEEDTWKGYSDFRRNFLFWLPKNKAYNSDLPPDKDAPPKYTPPPTSAPARQAPPDSGQYDLSALEDYLKNFGASKNGGR